MTRMIKLVGKGGKTKKSTNVKRFNVDKESGKV